MGTIFDGLIVLHRAKRSGKHSLMLQIGWEWLRDTRQPRPCIRQRELMLGAPK